MVGRRGRGTPARFGKEDGMTLRTRSLGALAAPLALALLLGACASGDNDDVKTAGADPYVTEGGTTRVFAQTEPGIETFPMPNDLVWLADGDECVELEIEPDDTEAVVQLKTLVNLTADPTGECPEEGVLKGLSPAMFLTVPVTGAVDPDTAEAFVFRLDDPQLPAVLGALAQGNLQAAGAALAQMEIRTTAAQAFVAGTSHGVLKLLPKTPFTPGARYAAVLKTTLEDAQGFAVNPSFGMTALKSTEPFGSTFPYARFEPLRAAFNEADTSTAPPTPALFDIVAAVTGVYFQGAAWTRDDVLALWTFHTADLTVSLTPTAANPAARVLAYPDGDSDPFAGFTGQLRSVSAGFEANQVTWQDRTQDPPALSGTPVPLPAAAVLPPSVPQSHLGFVLFGQYQSPTLAGATDTVPFLIATPGDTKTFPPPWPVVVFQHGITREKEIAFAVADAFAAAGFATFAIDAPFHGDRTVEDGESGDGFVTPNLIQTRANAYQASIDLWEALDVIEAGLDLGLFEEGSELDAGSMHLCVHSLGSIITTPFLSQDTRSRSQLFASPSALLGNVVDDTEFPTIVPFVDGFNVDRGTTGYYVLLNLMQWLFDPVDAAWLGIGGNDPANTLTNAALDDPFVPNDSTRVFLAGLGISGFTDANLDDVNLANPPAGAFPGLAGLAPGAYRYGVEGDGTRPVPVPHGFFLSPSIRDDTGAVEPWYEGYEVNEAKFLNATVGAQTQAAGFFGLMQAGGDI